MSVNEPRLTGGYVLEFSEDQSICWVKHGRGSVMTSGGGTFDGTIEQIGWNDRFILAKVRRIYRGDPDGWYVLSVKSGEVRGPLSEQTIAADSTLRGIQCFDPRAPHK
jgi:hypothetical protein